MNLEEMVQEDVAVAVDVADAVVVAADDDDDDDDRRG